MAIQMTPDTHAAYMETVREWIMRVQAEPRYTRLHQYAFAKAYLARYDSAYKAHRRFRNRLICLAILCLGAAGLIYRWIR